MSMNKQIRVTAYLKFLCPKKHIERAELQKCCGKKPSGKFCAVCGTAAKNISTMVTVDAVNQRDLTDEIDESLCYLQDPAGVPEDDFDIWYPNEAGVLDEDAVGHQAITGEMITDAKDTIEQSYSEDIATLTKHYGSAPEVCFGMLVWWS